MRLPALMTQGAADGLTISVVTEPASLALLNMGLLTLILFRRARSEAGTVKFAGANHALGSAFAVDNMDGAAQLESLGG